MTTNITDGYCNVTVRFDTYRPDKFGQNTRDIRIQYLGFPKVCIGTGT